MKWRNSDMIIDCHCHAGAGDGFTGPWDTSAPLDKYLRWARESGITQTVMFPAFHSDYWVANRQVARIVARLGRRAFGFAFVHPARDAGRVARMVGELVRVHGFVGIKVHRHDGRITREICDVARRWQIPILYDVMGETSSAHLLAAAYPDVSFIIPHLGSFADDWKAQIALIDPLTRYANLFTDTSGVRRFDLLEETLVRAGPQKILFGSDGPWLHPGVELEKIRRLPLTSEGRQLVLADNWLRLTQRVRDAHQRRLSNASVRAAEF